MSEKTVQALLLNSNAIKFSRRRSLWETFMSLIKA